MNKLFESIPDSKKSKLSKKAQEKEDKTRRNLQKANQYWNDWKIQIHWNKLGWVKPRNCNAKAKRTANSILWKEE